MFNSAGTPFDNTGTPFDYSIAHGGLSDYGSFSYSRFDDPRLTWAQHFVHTPDIRCFPNASGQVGPGLDLGNEHSGLQANAVTLQQSPVCVPDFNISGPADQSLVYDRTLSTVQEVDNIDTSHQYFVHIPEQASEPTDLHDMHLPKVTQRRDIFNATFKGMDAQANYGTSQQSTVRVPGLQVCPNTPTQAGQASDLYNVSWSIS